MVVVRDPHRHMLSSDSQHSKCKYLGNNQGISCCSGLCRNLLGKGLEGSDVICVGVSSGYHNEVFPVVWNWLGYKRILTQWIVLKCLYLRYLLIYLYFILEIVVSSYPGTNQARLCLASEIRWDRAHSGWYGCRLYAVILMRHALG